VISADVQGIPRSAAPSKRKPIAQFQPRTHKPNVLFLEKPGFSLRFSLLSQKPGFWVRSKGFSLTSETGFLKSTFQPQQ
jgi:hypothetical protein